MSMKCFYVIPIFFFVAIWESIAFQTNPTSFVRVHHRAENKASSDFKYCNFLKKNALSSVHRFSSARNHRKHAINSNLDVSDSSFRKQVLESSGIMLVSFWAPWCGPCRMIKPVLEEIESDSEGKIKIAYINTDENQETATNYGIRSIPTLILFKDGTRVETIIGAIPKATLEAKLSQYI